MSEKIRLLMLEDNVTDAELMETVLRREGLDFSLRRVDTREAFLQELKELQPDLVLADYTLLAFDGLSALALAQEEVPDTPFIFVSGTMEEFSIHALRLGAKEYVLKHQFSQLGLSVRRALQEAQEAHERQEVEAALRKSEERFRFLVEATNDLVWEIDTEARFTYVSGKVIGLLGYLPEEILGKSPHDLIPQDGAGNERELLQFLLKLRRPYDYVGKTYLHKSGRLVVVESSGLPIFNPKGVFLGFRGIDRDITERKRVESTLLRAKEEWEATFEAMLDPVMLLDNQHRILRLNRAMAAALGVSPGEATGLPCYKTVHGLESPPDFCPHVCLLADGQPHETEIFEPRLGGYHHVTVVPLKDNTGRVIGSIHVSHNITARKQAEERLSYQAQLLSSVNDAIVAADLDFRITYWNTAAERIYGWNKEEVLGKPIAEIIPVKFLNNLTREETRREVMEKGTWRGEAIHYNRDGQEIIIDWSITVIRDLTEGIVGTVSVSRDRTDRHRMERALQERERFLHSIFASIQDGICVLDRNLQILQVNPTMERWYAQHSPLVGKKCYEVFRGHNKPCEICPTRRALESGQAESEEVPLRDPSQNITGWMELFSFPLTDGHTGKVTGVIEYIRDITERRRAEVELRESEDRFRTMFELASVGMAQADPRTGRWLRVNQKLCAITGYTADELLGKRFSEITHPKDRQRDWEAFQQVIEGEAPDYRNEKRYIKKDGTIVWVNVNVTVHKDSSGQPLFTLAVIEDITARKQAEDEIRRLASFPELNPNPVLEIDEQGVIVYANPAARQVSENLGLNEGPGAFLPPDLQKLFARAHQGGPRQLFFDLALKDIVYAVLLSFPQDLPMARLYALDITERKQAEAALRESEAKFRGLLETMNDGFGTVDEDGLFVFANDKLCKILGMAKGEIIGRQILEVWGPLLQQAEIEMLKVQLARSRQGESGRYGLEFKRRDGLIKTVLISASPMYDASGHYKGNQEVVTDITEWKEAEKTRLLLGSAVEQSYEIIIIMDSNRIIQYVNPAFERITGFAAKEVVGRDSEMLYRSEQGDQRELPDGMWETLKHGSAWHGQVHSNKKDGSSFEQRLMVSPIANHQEAISNYVSVGLDVTHLLELERRLWQAQKMEAIGTLAAGIAHDFNNILGSIILNTELALDDESIPDSPSGQFLKRVLTAGERARDLVDQILTFSRQTDLERQPMDIVPVLDESLKFVRGALPSTIDIYCEFKECGPVMANAIQIHQVVLNLCSNAAHAMKQQGGALFLMLEEVNLDEDAVAKYPELHPGRYAKLSVRDTGTGIDRPTLERIFDPFFSTKAPGEGTGMGLAVVHGIITEYGGAILVHSEPRRGSTFEVFLPIIKSEAAPTKECPAAVACGTEHVFIVDDEEGLLEATQHILERLGYEVTSHANSLEALEAFRSQPQQFDLVITDFTMPLMPGPDLAKELLKIRADLPIILCTGLNEAVSKEIRQLGIRGFLKKPITRQQLANKVRQVLDQIV